MEEEVLSTVTIYQSPADFPGMVVVRRFWIQRGNLEPVPEPLPLAVVPTLAAARTHVPGGMNCLGRNAEDHPTIVETWI